MELCDDASSARRARIGSARSGNDYPNHQNRDRPAHLRAVSAHGNCENSSRNCPSCFCSIPGSGLVGLRFQAEAKRPTCIWNPVLTGSCLCGWSVLFAHRDRRYSQGLFPASDGLLAHYVGLPRSNCGESTDEKEWLNFGWPTQTVRRNLARLRPAR